MSHDPFYSQASDSDDIYSTPAKVASHFEPGMCKVPVRPSAIILIITYRGKYIAGCSNLHSCVRRRSTEHEWAFSLVTECNNASEPYLRDEDRRRTEARDPHRLLVPLGINEVANSVLHQSAVSSTCERETGFFVLQIL